MAKIHVITSGATKEHGEALAEAIQRKFGAEVSVSSPPTNPNPRDTESLGRIFDTLAVLRETESTLRLQALRLISEHPELVRGSKTLTLDERIANTVSNRANTRAVYADSRPMYPAEEMILAGAAVAVGGEAQHLGAAIYLTAQHQQTTEGQFRERLNHPERSTIELGEQIQRRVEERLESAESDWDAWQAAAERGLDLDYEPGDD